MTPPRLAIVTSHPTQYYAPWFRHLAAHLAADLRVHYLWDREAGEGALDPEFGRSVRWDTDLLDGYAHEFVPNVSSHPGTQRFGGLHNPSLPARLSAWEPDVLLLFGYGWRTPLQLALAWRRCPLVLRGDSHDLAPDKRSLPGRRLGRLARRIVFRRFAAFAAVGAANRDHYLSHGVPSSRIFPVPHCVDNARFTAPGVREAALAWRAELGIPATRLVVGFAGKFIPKKQPDALIRAFRRLAPPDAALLLIGDGTLRPQLEKLAEGRRDILLAPFQNQSAMPRALAALDLLVLPSLGPEETWGLVVNEAMAAGVPCLVSTHAGCRADLIEEDRTGWSFPAGDEAALAAQLGRSLAALRERRLEFQRRIAHRIARYSYAQATAGLQVLLDALRNPPAQPQR
ncbi:MAG: glycosyl transferase [Opitutus sp.]|nr:glycosyl transferase [Opitutus sp.]